MKLLAILALALTPTLALADAEYNDSAATVTHDCTKDPVVAVNASSGKYTFTGACKTIKLNGASSKVAIESVEKLAVNGASNIVDIGATDSISISGASNKITWKRGLTKAKPKVSASGVGNKVAKAK